MSRRLAERAAAAWVSLVAAAMVAAGLLLAGMGATLHLTAFDITEIAALASSLMAMGAALAITGAVGAVANRRTSRPSWAPAEVDTGRLTALVAAAAALPVLLAVPLTPLFSYWHDLVRAADQHDVFASLNGPSALVFLPAAGVLLVPALEAIAAIAIAFHSATVAVLTLMRSAAVRALSAIGAVLVGGLCAGSWVGVVTTERLAPAVRAQIRTSPDATERARILDLVERHRSVSVRSAQTLSLGWVAVVLISVGTRAVVRASTRPGDDVTRVPQPLSTGNMDEHSREKALLDAADRLHRNTPPRRF